MDLCLPVLIVLLPISNNSKSFGDGGGIKWLPWRILLEALLVDSRSSRSIQWWQKGQVKWVLRQVWMDSTWKVRLHLGSNLWTIEGSFYEEWILWRKWAREERGWGLWMGISDTLMAEWVEIGWKGWIVNRGKS